jgi:hypothetical protein
LIAVGVAADDDGFLPACHQTRDPRDDNRLTEDGPAEDVPDRCMPVRIPVSVRAGGGRRGTDFRWDSTTSVAGFSLIHVQTLSSPRGGGSHLFEMKLLHPRFIWSDGRALDTYRVL